MPNQTATGKQPSNNQQSAAGTCRLTFFKGALSGNRIRFMLCWIEKKKPVRNGYLTGQIMSVRLV